MGKFFTILILAVLAAGAYVWATPYLTIQKLADAMEDEDTVRVDAYVDFDAVRAGFQNDFVTSLGLEDSSQSSSASIGNILATRLAGAFLSGIVSPETFVSVLKDHDRRERLGLSDDFGTLMQRGEWLNKDQFILHDDSGRPTMLMQRKGIAWEVTAISLK